MTERHWNRRAGTLLFLVMAILVLAGITAAGSSWKRRRL